MNVIDIFLISFYIHFCRMKERGRNVVPWFQTTTAISFFMAISVALLLKIILGESFDVKDFSEYVFIIGFLIIMGIVFFSVKRYLFDGGRHLILAEKYMNEYTSKQRLAHKIISMSLILGLPFVLGFIIWYIAPPV